MLGYYCLKASCDVYKFLYNAKSDLKESSNLNLTLVYRRNWCPVHENVDCNY